jgi:hypothetical protein
MPRFYFHARDLGGNVSPDSEGQELPDLEAARREATNASREMLGEQLLHGGASIHGQIEIADEEGLVLAVVKARDTLLDQDQPRVFRDDVTQSAPKGVMASSEKAEPR